IQKVGYVARREPHAFQRVTHEPKPLTSPKERSGKHHMEISIASPPQFAKFLIVVAESLCIAKQHVVLHRFEIRMHIRSMNPIFDQRFGNKTYLLQLGDSITEIPISRSRKASVETAH